MDQSSSEIGNSQRDIVKQNDIISLFPGDIASVDASMESPTASKDLMVVLGVLFFVFCLLGYLVVSRP